jgi:hypothetical protein
MGQQSEAGTPVAPETPVIEKVPGHQRCSEETTDERHDRKEDIENKDQSCNGPTKSIKFLAHFRKFS